MAKILESMFVFKLIYKPMGLILGVFAGLISKRFFEFIWSKFDRENPPGATTLETSWPKVLGAAAVEGLTFKVTRAAVDRAGAKGFHWITGVWPGEKSVES